MAVSEQVLQVLANIAGMLGPLIQLAQTQHKLMSQMLRDIVESGGGEVQGRGIGKRSQHRGAGLWFSVAKPIQSMEWKAKFVAYLRIHFHNKCDEYVRWARVEKEAPTQSNLGMATNRLVLEVSCVLNSELMGCCVKEPFHTSDIFEGGNGLEALRRLMNKYEPGTVLTESAPQDQITNTPARRLDELEAPLHEYFLVTPLFESCVKELSDKLERSNKYMLCM